MLMAGDIDMGHARALLALDGAQQIIEAQRDRRQEASACARPRGWSRAQAQPGRQTPLLRANGTRSRATSLRLEQQLSDALDGGRRDPRQEAHASAASRARSRSRSARSTSSTACSARLGHSVTLSVGRVARAATSRTRCVAVFGTQRVNAAIDFGTLLANAMRRCQDREHEWPIDPSYSRLCSAARMNEA